MDNTTITELQELLKIVIELKRNDPNNPWLTPGLEQDIQQAIDRLRGEYR